MNGGFTGIDFETENNNTNNLTNTGNVDDRGFDPSAYDPTAYSAMPTTQPTAYSAMPTTQPTAYGVMPTTQPTAYGVMPATAPTSIPLNNNMDSEVLGNTSTMDLTGVNQTVNEENKNIDPTLPNTRGVDSSSASLDIRMNPITGEEINIKDVLGNKDENTTENDEKLKKVKVEYRPASAFSSFLLILFFVFLIAFVIFLPEIEATFSDYLDKRNGNNIVREITTGKLVCTLKSNTANLDKNYERIFNYEDNKLKSSKLTTVTRGDISLDEDTLTKLNDQCNEIKKGVESLDGIKISCKLGADKLEEVEVFEYDKYDIDKVSQIYLDNESSILDLELDADINIVMTTMRQSGFTCDKQK